MKTEICNTVTVAEFKREDVDAVIEFEKELRRQEPDTYFWEIDKDYRTAVENSFLDPRFQSSALSLLAWKAGKVVGRIDAALLLSRFDGTVCEAYLNWICVLKNERHSGIAQGLLTALREQLSEKKVDYLVCLTAGNDEATKFYDSVSGIQFDRGATIRTRVKN